MNISEVCYEAACRMSDYDSVNGYWTCLAIAEADQSDEHVGVYQAVMACRDNPNGYEALRSNDVYSAAQSVGWGSRDYRTFMLLMASEALK